MSADGQGTPRLWERADLSEPEVLDLDGARTVVFTHRSPAKVGDPDGVNEDGALALACGGHGWVLAVADGVGGHAAGEQASREALQALRDAVRKALGAGRSLRDGILDGFEEGNRRVTALPADAATTLVAVEIMAGSARVYHAGDSVAVITGQRGRLKHETTPHSPVGYAVESGLLAADDALDHAQRHIISNALGGEDMHIAVGPSVRLAPRDTVVLASDGLFDNLSTAEVVEFVRVGPLETAVDRLVACCRLRMAGGAGDRPSKPDDLTVVAWRLPGEAGH